MAVTLATPDQAGMDRGGTRGTCGEEGGEEEKKKQVKIKILSFFFFSWRRRKMLEGPVGQNPGGKIRDFACRRAA